MQNTESKIADRNEIIDTGLRRSSGFKRENTGVKRYKIVTGKKESQQTHCGRLGREAAGADPSSHKG